MKYHRRVAVFCWLTWSMVGASASAAALSAGRRAILRSRYFSWQSPVETDVALEDSGGNEESAPNGQANPDEDTTRDQMRSVVIRPHASEGRPENISFGIFCKDLGHLNMLRGTFFADLVITLIWTDQRAGELVHSLGANKVTLSASAAARRLWLPDVKITNREIKGLDVVSSAVTVDNKGTVVKVERVLAELRNSFSVSAFPFDSQSLEVRLASTSLMSDELKFSPMENTENVTGVGATVLENADFAVTGTSSRVFEEVDSSLRKSRAELIIQVQRKSAPYIQSLLLPELLVLAISLSVFWFPLLGPFAMPRVGTALISFLALTTLGLRTNSMVPIRGGLAWIDLFETCCQSIMLFTLLLNIFVLVIYHSLQEKALAERIDKELRASTPLWSIGVFSFCFYYRSGSQLMTMNLVINNLLTVVGLCYLAFCMFRLRRSIREEKTEDVPPPAPASPVSPSSVA